MTSAALSVREPASVPWGPVSANPVKVSPSIVMSWAGPP